MLPDTSKTIEEEVHTSGSQTSTVMDFKALLKRDIFFRGNRGQEVSLVVDMKGGKKLSVLTPEKHIFTV